MFCNFNTTYGCDAYYGTVHSISKTQATVRTPNISSFSLVCFCIGV